MLLDIVKQLNWIDVLVIIFVLRVCYISIKGGLPIEFFKLLGVILSIYLSLHYYTLVSDWMAKLVPASIDKMPLEFLDFLAFATLAIAGYLVSVIFRNIFYRFIKMEAVPNLNKWGGFVLGLARGYLLIGLIVFTLVISTIPYLKTSVQRSYSGSYWFKIAPTTYSWLWNGIISKFMAKEKFNKTIFEVEGEFLK